MKYYNFKYKAESGYQKKEDQRIEDVLNAFLRLCEEFADKLDGDMPYCYNERASVSCFAVAASRKGFLVLEEYATTKKYRGDRRARAPGRGDLWAFDTVCGKTFGFEAKQCFPRSGCKEGTISGVLKSAARDATHLLDSDLRYGIAFFAPKLKNTLEGREEIVQSFIRISELVKGCSPTHFCSILAREPEKTLSSDRVGNEYFWPGVIVAVVKAV